MSRLSRRGHGEKRDSKGERPVNALKGETHLTARTLLPSVRRLLANPVAV